MIVLNQICNFLDEFAPTRLAEEWDNVGLLVGDRHSSVGKIMTCLTVTPESVAEAIAAKADLIVSHHPIPFRPLKKVTTDRTNSRMLWELIRAGIAVYSPHTGFDSAPDGINQRICQNLELAEIRPLSPLEVNDTSVGAGRFGELSNPISLADFLQMVKGSFFVESLGYVGNLTHSVKRVATACGSGGSFLDQAIKNECDTFITGETTFHTCLEAKANQVALILVGHYSSERFAIEYLADRLQQEFSEASVWASRNESDPVCRI